MGAMLRGYVDNIKHCIEADLKKRVAIVSSALLEMLTRILIVDIQWFLGWSTR